MGDGGGGHWLARMDLALSRMDGVSASVNLPLHHKIQKFSSGTGSPGWSQKKGRKTVVVCDVTMFLSRTLSRILSVISQNSKMPCDTEHTHSRVMYHVCASTHYDQPADHIWSASPIPNIWWQPQNNFKMDHMTRITPILGAVCHLKANNWYGLPVYKNLKMLSFSHSRDMT